jgi:hypothetical protein
MQNYRFMSEFFLNASSYFVLAQFAKQFQAIVHDLRPAVDVLRFRGMAPKRRGLGKQNFE